MMVGSAQTDCCLCFPLDCGVKTLFFLTAIGAVLIVVNMIGMLVNRQWYVLIQLVMLLPICFTLYYVVQYNFKDCYAVRCKICDGFKYMFITNLVINIILFIVVLTALDRFMGHVDNNQNA